MCFGIIVFRERNIGIGELEFANNKGCSGCENRIVGNINNVIKKRLIAVFHILELTATNQCWLQNISFSF